MTSRDLPIIRDHITPGPIGLLNATIDRLIPDVQHERPGEALYPGSHLVYFPSQTPLSSLLPDGTDPLHSPGFPFIRRVWAGGSMEFLGSVPTDCSMYQLNENIANTLVKGHGDDQKIFVEIERKIRQRNHSHLNCAEGNEKLRIRETRNLCFMSKKLPATSANAKHATPKTIIPQQTPDTHHTLIPTPALLFRFSALTFNAHAIHLDRMYCQEVEGHRNLLVHGPLSIILLLQFLRTHLSKLNKERISTSFFEVIRAVDYKNLAPLYAEEEMTLCLKRREEGPEAGSFLVWIVGSDGGYAVKGTVRTLVKRRKGLVTVGSSSSPNSDSEKTLIRKVGSPDTTAPSVYND